MEARGSRSSFSKWRNLYDPEMIEGFRDTATMMLLRKLKRRHMAKVFTFKSFAFLSTFPRRPSGGETGGRSAKLQLLDISHLSSEIPNLTPRPHIRDPRCAQVASHLNPGSDWQRVLCNHCSYHKTLLFK